MMGWLKEWFSKKVAIAPTSYLILDTETSGLNPSKDALLSWAALPLFDNRVAIDQCYYSQIIRDPNHYTTASLQIHGLMHKEGFESEEASLAKLHKLCEGRVLVGHHIEFDIAFVKEAFKKLGFPKRTLPFVDTFSLAIKKDWGPQYDIRLLKKEDYSLEALCEKYGINVQDRHTAYGDAWATLALFLLLKR
jgi:DNA polymerase III subunit epsilon